MNWNPHITVAAVIEKDERFLCVEETSGGKVVLNQPAGHWEKNETLLDAVIREVLEETAWHFRPLYVVGIYQWTNPANAETFLRFCFGGELIGHDHQANIDPEILRIVWLSYEELVQDMDRHRSPLVRKCLDDYRSGLRHDIKLLQTLPSL